MARATGPRLALVLLLAVALGASVSATAVASAGSFDGPSGQPTMAAVAPADADRSLDSGGLYWAGQTAFFDGSEVVADVQHASTEERTFRLRRVTSDGEVGVLVREFVVDVDGTTLLNTGGLEGRYVVLHDGDVVYVQNGTGYTSAPPDGSPVTVESSRWEVATQTVSAEWSDDTVFRSSTVDLRVTSNRAEYVLAVSADGLEFEDLVSMFDSDDLAADHDARADEDVLLLEAGGETAFEVRFADLENGRYTLVLEAADTDARTTAEVRVGRPSSGEESPSPTASPTPVPPTTTVPMPSPQPSPSPTSRAPTTTSTSGTSPAPTERPTTATESPGQPGFGPVVALVALGLGLLVTRRRRP